MNAALDIRRYAGARRFSSATCRLLSGRKDQEVQYQPSRPSNKTVQEAVALAVADQLRLERTIDEVGTISVSTA